MTGTALVLTAGILAESNAKTAHGLLRGPSRFRLLGVVDDRHAGRDAGCVVDGRRRAIPCFATLVEALAALPEPPDWLIVGVAFHGGRMPETMRATVLEGVRRGIGAVNGLHQLLADDPEIAAAAAISGARLHDIRRTPKFAELRFWTGEALELEVPRVAVLGTDCALGKRTTATFLLEGLRQRGLTTELVTTGQTGWLQGHRFGFILDATPNDFVTGELERAVVACAREATPELILLEGQSALRNPSGPCGAELLLAGGATGVVLQHAPGREFFDGCEALGIRIPPVEDEVELIERYGVRVLGLALNGENLDAATLAGHAGRLHRSLGIPVAMPLVDRCEPLLEALTRFARSPAREAARSPTPPPTPETA
ncbi:MAG: DUF1611 domain-containing protein [Thermoanaerobaculia bacterium]|jgi:uncharacterized NAD-dependent epimerase/dehydratase family protein|nr:DUF1611 domain-containing protein [Thermoanaerobaculia bacterium]MBP9824855.1 DUF1611 domain-containing protein [Thermoanaerobaculia bacterium]